MASASAAAIDDHDDELPIATLALPPKGFERFVNMLVILRRMRPHGSVAFNFYRDKLAIYLPSSDGAAVCFVEICQDTMNFVGTYECRQECVAGVHLATLCQYLKEAKTNDVVTLQLVPSEIPKRSLRVWIHPKNGQKDSLVDIHVLDEDHTEIKFPQISQQPYTVVTMSSEDFQKKCRSNSGNGNDNPRLFTLFVAQDGLCLQTVSDQRKNSIAFDVQCDGPVNAEDIDVDLIAGHPYQVGYLNIMSKANKINNTVNIMLCHGKPLIIEYEAPYVGIVRMYIAPQAGALSESHAAQHRAIIRTRLRSMLSSAPDP